MPRLSGLPNDNSISRDDKIVGSNSSNNKSLNISLGDLVDFLKAEISISLGANQVPVASAGQLGPSGMEVTTSEYSAGSTIVGTDLDEAVVLAGTNFLQIGTGISADFFADDDVAVDSFFVLSNQDTSIPTISGTIESINEVQRRVTFRGTASANQVEIYGPSGDLRNIVRVIRAVSINISGDLAVQGDLSATTTASIVAHDESLTGDGTIGNPLAVNPASVSLSSVVNTQMEFDSIVPADGQIIRLEGVSPQIFDGINQLFYGTGPSIGETITTDRSIILTNFDDAGVSLGVDPVFDDANNRYNFQINHIQIDPDNLGGRHNFSDGTNQIDGNAAGLVLYYRNIGDVSFSLLTTTEDSSANGHEGRIRGVSDTASQARIGSEGSPIVLVGAELGVLTGTPVILNDGESYIYNGTTWITL